MCFSPFLGVWRTGRGGVGSRKGLVHNLLKQFPPVDNSKIKVFKTNFFDTMITYNDDPSYVKHASRRIYVFFTLFGYYALKRRGSPRRQW